MIFTLVIVNQLAYLQAGFFNKFIVEETQQSK